MATRITQERPDTSDATALILELEEHLSALYPVESRFGYSVDKLLQTGVAFFVMRHDGALAGCGGVQIYRPQDEESYGELKRMYVRPQLRGQGLSKVLLTHLASYTQEQGVTLLRLETGIYQKAAIGLYEGWGFQRIGPFGDYPAVPLSIFYEKRLA